MDLLIDDLFEYKKRYMDESEKVGKMLTFIKTENALLGKVNTKGHLTASGWILDKNFEYVLLTHHAKLNMWIQLGGHTEEDESVYQSAHREVIEESGLKNIKGFKEIFDIDIHLIPPYKDTKGHYHYDIRYVFVGDKDEKIVVTNESIDLKWIKLEDVKNYTNEESILRMVEKTKVLRMLNHA